MVLYLRHENLNYVTNNLQQDLVVYHQWCLFDKLSLNTKKNKLMLFTDNKRKTPIVLPPITISGNTLSYVDSLSYVGVNLDVGLNLRIIYKVSCLG